MSTFLQYLPSILGAVGAVASLFSGEIQTVIAAHPAVAGVIAGVYSILTHFLPSPSASAPDVPAK